MQLFSLLSLHPALCGLMRAQRMGKLRRLRRGFSSRRRILLSLLAMVLATVWVGNVLLGAFFRAATPPERFGPLVATGFFLYGAWHLLKNTFKRPESAIEWTPAEEELLCAGPFRRQEVIAYRMRGVLHATLLKAICLTCLMWPDLSCIGAGLVGAILALFVLDLLRLAIEITAFGISARWYWLVRVVMGGVLLWVVVRTLAIGYSAPPGWRDEDELFPLSVVRHFGSAAWQLLETPLGTTLMTPFAGLATVITTRTYDGLWWSRTFLAAVVAGGLIQTVYWLDGFWAAARSARERADYPPRSKVAAAHPRAGRGRCTGPSIPWLVGAGPIAWRQLRGALRQGSQLAVAMALPGMLALLPITFCRTGTQAHFHVSAALAFYSFLLLPTALKFDFRRDIQRMAILKTLPVRPAALVIGQIATPTLLALAFQAIVLGAALCIQPFPLWLLGATLLVLAPLNAMIFAVDNLLYLLYPYRLNQEGLEIFLRTTLTFTAKGLIFAAGLGLTLGWSYLARRLALMISVVSVPPATVFVAGGVLLLSLCTGLAVVLLSQAYQRFDPSQDAPA